MSFSQKFGQPRCPSVRSGPFSCLLALSTCTLPDLTDLTERFAPANSIYFQSLIVLSAELLLFAQTIVRFQIRERRLAGCHFKRGSYQSEGLQVSERSFWSFLFAFSTLQLCNFEIQSAAL